VLSAWAAVGTRPVDVFQEVVVSKTVEESGKIDLNLLPMAGKVGSQAPVSEGLQAPGSRVVEGGSDCKEEQVGRRNGKYIWSSSPRGA
jgi:hypothetical protein